MTCGYMQDFIYFILINIFLIMYCFNFNSLYLVGFFDMRFILFVLIVCCPFVCFADMNCRTNSLGITHCYGDNNRHIVGRNTATGSTVYTDNQGNTITKRTNSFGVTSYSDNKGNTTRARTNSLGVTTYQDNNGNTWKSRTNSLGVTTYQDSNGNTTRCRTNSLGITRCN